MLFWIIQTAGLSMIVIFIVHYLVIYFQDNYTIKKTKDLTEIQTKKYKTILDEMEKINEKEKKEILHHANEMAILPFSFGMNNEPEPHIISQNELSAMDEDLSNFIQSIQ